MAKQCRSMLTGLYKYHSNISAPKYLLTWSMSECRFEPGGAYSQMVLNGDIVNWVVVDLRSTPRKPRQHSRPDMLHVLFSPDFRSAEIIDTQQALVYLQDTF